MPAWVNLRVLCAAAASRRGTTMVFGQVGETMELVFVVLMTIVGIGFLILVQARSQQP